MDGADVGPMQSVFSLAAGVGDFSLNTTLFETESGNAVLLQKE